MLNNRVDIWGLTVYNNAEAEPLLWFFVNRVFDAAAILGKPVKVVEYQTAPWLDQDKQPVYPFSIGKFFSGLEILKSKKPFSIHFWDVEQVIWRALNGDRQYQLLLNYLKDFEVFSY